MAQRRIALPRHRLSALLVLERKAGRRFFIVRLVKSHPRPTNESLRSVSNPNTLYKPPTGLTFRYLSPLWRRLVDVTGIYGRTRWKMLEATWTMRCCIASEVWV